MFIKYFLLFGVACGVFSHAKAHAAINYGTSCIISSDKAMGYIDNYSDSFMLNGKTGYFFFDAGGNMIGTKHAMEEAFVGAHYSRGWSYAHAQVIPGAARCVFDPGPAIVGHPRQPMTNSTSCRIRDGRAVGVISSHGEQIVLEGKAWFVFSKKSYAGLRSRYVNVSIVIDPKQTSTIETTEVPYDAYYCGLILDEAIKELRLSSNSPNPIEAQQGRQNR